MSVTNPDDARPAGSLQRVVWRARHHPAAVALIVVSLLSAIALGLLAELVQREAEEARFQAEVAQRAEEEALARAQMAEAELARANALLAESRDHLLDSLSRSLLRPLGLKSGLILDGAELEALKELADMSEDKARLRFLEVGLASPETAESLGRRAEAVVRSAVGLDPERRQAALSLVRARLQDGADPRIRLACALLGAALGETEPEFVRKASATLVEVMETTPDPVLLALALRTLGRKEPDARRRLPGAAKSLIDRLGKDAAFVTVVKLVQAVEALTDRLTQDEAAAAARRIVEKLQQTPSADTLHRLTLTLVILLEWLAPGEERQLAGAAGMRLAEQLGRRIALSEIEPLAGALRAVSGRMTQQDATTAAGRAVEQMATPARAGEYGALAQVIEILAARMETREADRLARMAITRILEQTGKPALPFMFPGLPLAIEVLAKRLTSAEVEQAWRWVVEQLGHWSDPYQRVPLSHALKALRERLSADEAGRLALPAAAKLVERMQQTKDPHGLSTLALTVAAVTEGLKPADAAQPVTVAAGLLMEHIGKTSDLVLQGQLAGALKALRQRLGPDPVRQPAAVALTAQLIERMEKSLDPVEVRVLAQGLAALGGWIGPEEAKATAPRLSALMGKTNNAVGLHFCALALKALVVYLDAESARKLVAPAASRLLDLLGKPLPAGGFEIVAGALSVLADRVDSKEATQAAELVVHKLAAVSEPAPLAELTATLRPLLDHAAPAEARSLAFRAAARLSDHLAALDLLAERLDLQGLVDLLKRPTCVGPAREAVLRLLEQRGQRKFDDIWDLVEWLQKEHPAIDLRAAPLRG